MDKYISRFDSRFDDEYKRRNDRGNILRNIDEFNRKKEVESELAKSYYEYIGGEEARTIMRNDTESFSDTESNRIERIFRPRGREYKYGPYTKDTTVSYTFYTNTVPLYFTRKNKSKIMASIIIWKMTGFYYLVGIGSGKTHIFYKCDQMDALKFIIDKTLFEDE